MISETDKDKPQDDVINLDDDVEAHDLDAHDADGIDADEILDEDDFEAVEAEDLPDYEADEKPKRPFPRGIILAGFGVLLGLGLAVLIAWFLRPAPYDDAAVRADMNRMQAELQTEIDSLQSRPAPTPTDVRPLTRRVEALSSQLQLLERRLGALETTVSETADPAIAYESLVTRLEVLQEEGFEIPENFVFPDMPEPVDLSGVERRLEAVEGRIAALASQRAAQPVQSAQPLAANVDAALSEPKIDLTALPRFPGDRLREAADELSGEGLAKRIWSQHVRVRGEKSPRVLIKDIESKLAKSRPRAALASFDQLPEPMQSLARAWRADMASAIARADAANPPQIQ